MSGCIDGWRDTGLWGAFSVVINRETKTRSIVMFDMTVRVPPLVVIVDVLCLAFVV